MSAKQRIYDHFSQEIRDGSIKSGTMLPSEAKIAEQFSVSRSTVQAAMSRLNHEGIVSRRAGRGTFACKLDDDMQLKVQLDIHNIQSFESEIEVIGDRLQYKMMTFSKLPAPLRPAKKLGIEEGVDVYSLYRLRFVGDECIGSERRFFSPEIDLDISTHSLEKQGVHSIVEECIGLKIGRIEAALRAISASEQDAKDLGVVTGSPLLVRSHTLFAEDGAVILHGDSYYVEPFSFRYTANIRR